MNTHLSNSIKTNLPRTVAATAAGVMEESLQADVGSMAAWSSTTLLVDTREFIIGRAMVATERLVDDIVKPWADCILQQITTQVYQEIMNRYNYNCLEHTETTLTSCKKNPHHVQKFRLMLYKGWSKELVATGLW